MTPGDRLPRNADGHTATCAWGSHPDARCYCGAPRKTVPAPAHDLTPSEVALSKVLAAWVEWPGHEIGGEEPVMESVSGALYRRGLSERGEPTPTGDALLDRARKAGVL